MSTAATFSKRLEQLSSLGADPALELGEHDVSVLVYSLLLKELCSSRAASASLSVSAELIFEGILPDLRKSLVVLLVSDLVSQGFLPKSSLLDKKISTSDLLLVEEKSLSDSITTWSSLWERQQEKLFGIRMSIWLKSLEHQIRLQQQLENFLSALERIRDCRKPCKDCLDQLYCTRSFSLQLLTSMKFSESDAHRLLSSEVEDDKTRLCHELKKAAASLTLEDLGFCVSLSERIRKELAKVSEDVNALKIRIVETTIKVMKRRTKQSGWFSGSSSLLTALRFSTTVDAADRDAIGLPLPKGFVKKLSVLEDQVRCTSKILSSLQLIAVYVEDAMESPL